MTAATNRITPVGTTFPNSKVTVPSTGFGTPTIIVNGKAYTPPNNALGYKDAAAFAKFVKGLAPKVD